MTFLPKAFVKTVKLILRRAGIEVSKYPPSGRFDWRVEVFQRLINETRWQPAGNLQAAEDFLMHCFKHQRCSNAQLFQDLFVCWCMQCKTHGFFVEFGATNGVSLSNTHLLEKQYYWSGILAEPAICWQEELARNRTASLDNRCVFNTSGLEIEFSQVTEAELSTISSFSDLDHHRKKRASRERYSVETVSLNDLLLQHNAPRQIDYLSIDTEGSELLILQNVDFKAYQFGVITVEHNFTEQRLGIFELLQSQGYTPVFEQFSQWDDWYVHGSLLEKFSSPSASDVGHV